MDADFEKWARRDALTIEESAMLLLGAEPLNQAPYGSQSFKDVCSTIQRAIDAGILLASLAMRAFESPIESSGTGRCHWTINPRDFLAWARRKGYPIPPALEEAVNRFHPPGEDRPQAGADRPKWPWGDYDTPLLGHLRAAAERFWKNYDPSDPTTARNNKEVTAWLMARGVSKRNAEVIATILHDPRIPTGPRK